jgi:hypothetical protein
MLQLKGCPEETMLLSKYMAFRHSSLAFYIEDPVDGKLKPLRSILFFLNPS